MHLPQSLVRSSDMSNEYQPSLETYSPLNSPLFLRLLLSDTNEAHWLPLHSRKKEIFDQGMKGPGSRHIRTCVVFEGLGCYVSDKR